MMIAGVVGALLLGWIAATAFMRRPQEPAAATAQRTTANATAPISQPTPLSKPVYAANQGSHSTSIPEPTWTDYWDQQARYRSTLTADLAAIAAASKLRAQRHREQLEKLAAARETRRAIEQREEVESTKHSAAKASEQSGGIDPRRSGGLLVGDSVSLGAKPCLTPKGYRVDSEVGRQFSVGWQRLRDHAADGLPQSVVVHLGTNGPFSASQFQEVMNLLGSQRRVVWVTIHLPNKSQYSFRDSLNAMIRDQAAAFPNVRLADLARQGAQNPQWFYDDGIHITSAGCAGFTALVDDAVTQH